MVRNCKHKTDKVHNWKNARVRTWDKKSRVEARRGDAIEAARSRMSASGVGKSNVAPCKLITTFPGAWSLVAPMSGVGSARTLFVRGCSCVDVGFVHGMSAASRG